MILLYSVQYCKNNWATESYVMRNMKFGMGFGGMSYITIASCMSTDDVLVVSRITK